MASKRRVSAGICVLSVAFGVLLASCGESDPPTSPPPPGGGNPPPVTVVRLELTAPETIAPGQSVQLSVQAVKNDGSREDVTGRVRWSSTATDVVEIDAAGAASARQLGEALVGASFAAISATTRVFVLPPGTFRLSGRVHEFGAPHDNASIEVLEGIGAGLKTRSRTDGTYALYGVSGPIRLHLKKDGFLNATADLTVSSHLTRDLMLEPAGGRQPYTGTYSLIVTAVGPCTGNFPDEARRRVYTAHMRQGGTALTVTLADAEFILTQGYGNGFSGYNSRGQVFFDLRKADFYYYYYLPPQYQLVERATANMAVVVHGMAEGAGPTTHLRGRLGTISVTTRMTAPHLPFTASCNAEFEMVRQ